MTSKGVRLSHKGIFSVVLFALLISTETRGYWCCEWLDELRHRHHILHDLPCFYALQETTSAMNIPGYIVYSTDHGSTAILCLREVNHFRQLWVDNKRCTGILVGSTMHSGRDEVDYIEALNR